MTFEQEFAKGNTFYFVAKYWYELGQNSAKPDYYRAIDDALVCRDMTTTGNAKVDLNNLICMEQQVCLDPAVSPDARTLIRLSRMEAAKEIITLIMEWEGSWSVLDFKDAIKEKFGLEI